MALQGLFGILNGATSLLFPAAAASNCETLGVDSIPAMHAIALGSITIGAFYINAAYRRDRMAMWMSSLGRLIAMPVFVAHGGPWINVAVFEGVCAVLVAGALGWEELGRKKDVKKV